MTATPYGLARRSVGAGALWMFGTSASAPLTVLVGGVVAQFATTGVVGVPASFLMLAAALALFAVGFGPVTREVRHAAAFPAVLTLGLGRTAGLAGAAVALLSYNAIQISLYGLLGATAAGMLGGPWWVWALPAWALVGALGVRHIALNKVVVGVLLIAELVLIGVLDLVGFTHPANPTPAALLAPLAPGELLVDGVGSVLALGVAAFVGFESVTAFREEARHERSVATALIATVIFLGSFYTVSSWALAVAVGPNAVATITPDTPFALLDIHAGPVIARIGLGLLAVSIIGAMISFHHVVARYVFALGREGVFPAVFNAATTSSSARGGLSGRISASASGRPEGGAGTSGGRGGVPVAGSLLQSGLAVLTIAAFAMLGADPVATMFTQLSTLAALGVLTLMITASLAVVRIYQQPPPGLGRRSPGRPGDRFGRSGGGPGIGAGLLAPAAAMVVLGAVLVVTVANLATTTGDPAGITRWLLPAVVGLTGAGGVVWAGWVRRHRPWAWQAVGRGQPRNLGVVDDAVRIDL